MTLRTDELSDKKKDLETVLSALSDKQNDLSNYLFDTFLKHGLGCVAESGKIRPESQKVALGKHGMRLRLRMSKRFLADMWSYAANGRSKAIEEYTESKRKSKK